MWFKKAQNESYYYDPEEDLNQLTPSSPPSFIAKEMSEQDKIDNLLRNVNEIGSQLEDRVNAQVFPSYKDGVWKYLLFYPEDNWEKPSLEGTPYSIEKSKYEVMGWIKRQLELQGYERPIIDTFTLQDICQEFPYLNECDYFLGM